MVTIASKCLFEKIQSWKKILKNGFVEAGIGICSKLSGRNGLSWIINKYFVSLGKKIPKDIEFKDLVSNNLTKILLQHI